MYHIVFAIYGTKYYLIERLDSYSSPPKKISFQIYSDMEGKFHLEILDISLLPLHSIITVDKMKISLQEKFHKNFNFILSNGYSNFGKVEC
ncbi:10827_t:CDS:1, partial [Gigaspora rosea]